MKHLGTNKLETDRLILRPFTLNDTQAMYQNWATDHEVTKYLTWKPHDSIEVTKQYIEYIMEQYDNLFTYDWGIEVKENHELIGTIGTVKIDPEVESVHIGYCLGKKWWNQGYMTEAMEAVIGYLFEEVEVNRIDARYDIRNIASGKVMKACGMNYEGTWKQSDRNNHGRCDCAWYAILREEYKKH